MIARTASIRPRVDPVHWERLAGEHGLRTTGAAPNPVVGMPNSTTRERSMGWKFIRQAGIPRKLIILVGGSIAVFMIVFGSFAVSRVADVIRERTLAEA